MKTVFICGDSFGCPDLEWSVTPWPKILQQKLIPDWQVKNLSISCSSNLLISLQVDRAIKSQADYVIMLATSCTRFHGKIKDQNQHIALLDRFRRIGQHDPDESTKDLACYSLQSLDATCVFDQATQSIIHQYQKTMFDLDVEIYQNQIIIERNLLQLVRSGVDFVFEQGGFENPCFYTNNKPKKYFSEFDHYRSDIDQWSIAQTLNHSAPHKHILDQATHEKIANYYAKKIDKFSVDNPQ